MEDGNNRSNEMTWLVQTTPCQCAAAGAAPASLPVRDVGTAFAFHRSQECILYLPQGEPFQPAMRPR